MAPFRSVIKINVERGGGRRIFYPREVFSMRKPQGLIVCIIPGVTTVGVSYALIRLTTSAALTRALSAAFGTEPCPGLPCSVTSNTAIPVNKKWEWNIDEHGPLLPTRVQYTSTTVEVIKRRWNDVLTFV